VKTIANNELQHDTNLLEALKASSFTADLASSFSVFMRPTMNNQVLIDAAFHSSKRENWISRLRRHTAIVCAPHLTCGTDHTRNFYSIGRQPTAQRVSC
jgi:hypothetical protein